MGEPMPHAGYAAYLRATVDENGPPRTMTEAQMQKAAEIGDWARREKAADDRAADEDEGDEDEQQDGPGRGTGEPGSAPGTGRG